MNRKKKEYKLEPYKPMQQSKITTINVFQIFLSMYTFYKKNGYNFLVHLFKSNIIISTFMAITIILVLIIPLILPITVFFFTIILPIISAVYTLNKYYDLAEREYIIKMFLENKLNTREEVNFFKILKRVISIKGNIDIKSLYSRNEFTMDQFFNISQLLKDEKNILIRISAIPFHF